MFRSEADVGLQDLFTMSVERRTRGHPLKIVLPRCDFELRRKFFQVRVVQRWNSSSVQAVMKISLVGFKKQLEVEMEDNLYNVL